MDMISEAKNVFDKEIKALEVTRDSLDENFVNIVNVITNCKGKVVVTGVGKPGHVATKIAATLSSLGTPSFYLHPDEAMHGDLGTLSSDDVVIAISYSGESEEITRIISSVKYIGAKIIGITGNRNSMLANESDLVQVFPPFDEACHLGFAPTSSTTAEMCYGDAIAVVSSKIYGFDANDFGRIHPGGVLGKKTRLLVRDIMKKGDENAIVYEYGYLKDVIVELTKKKLGIVNVFDSSNRFIGIVSGGDIYRALESGCNIYTSKIETIVKKNPLTIGENNLVIDAVNIMKEMNIVGLPVINNKELVGTITMQDVMANGIV